MSQDVSYAGRKKAGRQKTKQMSRDLFNKGRMNLNHKLSVLNEIYAVYDQFSSSLTVSCVKGCAACCTRNVTLTTLEGHYIIRYIASNSQKHLLKKLKMNKDQRRFRPEITINGLARFYLEGKEAPSEDYPLEGRCPLLENDVCTIYPARPFGCRCFISHTDCRKTGVADVSPFTLTVNHLFMQFIEHVDADGLFGNLTDILLHLTPHTDVNSKKDGTPSTAHALITNRPIPMLLVPPEHQHRIAPILSRLRAIKVTAD